jgi:hypothetical protein
MSITMFKMGSFEAELAQSMSRQLRSNRLEKKAEINQNTRIVQSAKAVDCLHTAATLLDQLGRSAEAEIITKVLERVANAAHEDKEIPEIFEMTSLLHEDPEEEEDLGDQVIEIHMLPKKKV